MGNVIKQILGQLARRRGSEVGFAVVDQPLDFAIDLAEQQLDRGVGFQRAATHRFEHAAGDPPQAARIVVRAGRAQPIEHLDQTFELGAG